MCYAVWKNIQGPQAKRTRSNRAHHVSACVRMWKLCMELDTLVPNTNHSTLIVWVTACLVTQLFCRQKVFGTTRQDETVDTSGDTSTSDHARGNTRSRESKTMLAIDSVFAMPAAVKVLSTTVGLDNWREPHTERYSDREEEPWGCTTELYRIGYTTYENGIKERSFVFGWFNQNRGRQAVRFTLVNPLDNNPDLQFRSYRRWKSHHDALYVVDMERAQEPHFKFLQTLNGCVICFDRIPK